MEFVGRPFAEAKLFEIASAFGSFTVEVEKDIMKDNETERDERDDDLSRRERAGGLAGVLSARRRDRSKLHSQ